jgi:hypothetical protein
VIADGGYRSMTTVKVECDCGQRYAFDVEPIHGRMPAAVACPVCGADGTAKANATLAQMPVAPSPVIRPAAATVPVAAPVPVAQALPVAAAPPIALAVAARPPPLPAAPPPAAVHPGAPGRPPVMPGRLPAAKPVRGKDGWDSPETGLNKLGTYLVGGSAVIAALLAWGIFGLQVDWVILTVIVAVCGIGGGILNVLGRGPIWAGACVGLVMGLGGFGVTCWWIHGRQRAYKFELMLAFIIGCAPGIGLQYLLQRLVRRKTAA